MFARRYVAVLVTALMSFGGLVSRAAAQQDKSNFHVVVNMVQLEVAVTDSKGNYLTGLQPSDFEIKEDGITEKIASFGEGNQPVRLLISTPAAERAAESAGKVGSSNAAANTAAPDTLEGQQLGRFMAGANVFILFDTSNYMYKGFVYAQDAITEFVRSLDTPYRIAFYSYSRDLSRLAPLTGDRFQVLRAVRQTVAGDNAALYNALILTLKDAAPFSGKKAIVVFSNGPDNASSVAPEDVAELAESEEIPIYMISTRDARLDPISAVVFRRISAATGGEAYFAKNWRDQRRAFDSIRNDLEHLYSISYYPQANQNRGWRAIKVSLTKKSLRKYHIRTRSGYRPRPVRVPVEAAGGGQ